MDHRGKVSKNGIISEILRILGFIRVKLSDGWHKLAKWKSSSIITKTSQFFAGRYQSLPGSLAYGLNRKFFKSKPRVFSAVLFLNGCVYIKAIILPKDIGVFRI